MDNNKRSIISAIENIFAYVVLILLAVIPAAEIIAQKFFHSTLYASSLYVQHLTVWIAFLAGVIATREGAHLSLTYGLTYIKEPVKTWVQMLTSFMSIMISLIFFLCSITVVINDFGAGERIGVFPIQLILSLMPIALLVNTIHIIIRVPQKFRKVIAPIAVLFGLFLGAIPLLTSAHSLLNVISPSGSLTIQLGHLIDSGKLSSLLMPVIKVIFWPSLALFILSAFLGTPFFILLGGLAVLLYLNSTGGLINDVTYNAYKILRGEQFPAIPLFTLVGFILSESKAWDRLIKLFNALFGWLPGGLSIIAVLSCAFFTTFTGASGITILALGGLLYFMFIKEGYKEGFSTGILTASGSVGLLLPPSLPVIIYGVIAAIDIRKLFVGGLLPSFILILVLIIMGIFHAKKNNIKPIPFNKNEIIKPLLSSLGEILLPLLIIILYFGGITTLVQTGAIAVLYLIILEVFIIKDIRFKDLHKVFYKCLPVLGGVMIVFAFANEFSGFIVDQNIPTLLAQWMKDYISSPFVFLLLLNIVLLIAGSVMEIYSALIVIAPLIQPLGMMYGIDPVHLGIIFLANMELAFLMPPVGLNLFLASYRFEQPLQKIYSRVLPFLLLQFLAVLLITYAPWLTTWLVSVIKFN